jgi:uncharacterized protein (TIGR03000 family)
MPRQLMFSITTGIVALLLASSDVCAQHGRYYGPYHGGFYPHGYYRPYGYPYGWYRPYGVSIGIGFYVPYYGSYAYPVAPTYVVPAAPYAAPVVVGASPADPAGQPPTGAVASQKPPADNAGHFQLMVPENAEVLIDGKQIVQTGPVREIVTPALQAGTRYTYKFSVRYTNAQGKAVDDTREIHFQANDWFAIDFTRPAPPPAAAPPKQFQPVP